jgi:hypothetical protein
MKNARISIAIGYGPEYGTNASWAANENRRDCSVISVGRSATGDTVSRRASARTCRRRTGQTAWRSQMAPTEQSASEIRQQWSAFTDVLVTEASNARPNGTATPTEVTE